MKFTLVIAALVAAVSAQTIDQVPACAINCLEISIRKVTTCELRDYKCACKSFDKLQNDAAGCIVGACGVKTALEVVLPAIKALCKANGA